MENIEFEYEKDEKDEFSISKAELSQAVLFTTDWTVETVISQLTKDRISLTPTFQRRDAWRIDKKSRFIESILLGLPIPQIVLAEDNEVRGQFLVLDGKQRLLTLLQFVGEAPNSKWNSFRLKDLNYLTELEGKTYNDLVGSGNYDEFAQAFMNYPIRSSIIRNWPNPKYLETVFVRLNEGSLKLSPQELRQAMSPGPFSAHLDEFVWNSAAFRQLLNNSEPDFRMRDTELMLRFLAFTLFPENYKGNLKEFLDETMLELNDSWVQNASLVKRALADIDGAIQFGLDCFNGNFGKKFDVKTGDFANSLNRAVCEIEVYYLRDDAVREWVRKDPDVFLQILKKLTISNENFRNSIESTTKSLTAVGTRFGLLGDELAKEVPLKVRPLHIIDGRLVG